MKPEKPSHCCVCHGIVDIHYLSDIGNYSLPSEQQKSNDDVAVDQLTKDGDH